MPRPSILTAAAPCRWRFEVASYYNELGVKVSLKGNRVVMRITSQDEEKTAIAVFEAECAEQLEDLGQALLNAARDLAEV